MPYAAVTRYCKGTLLAVNLPPRTGNTITRLSPDLFSLIEAASNSGRGVAGWAKPWLKPNAKLAAAMARSIAIRCLSRIPRPICTLKPEEKGRLNSGFVSIPGGVRVQFRNTCAS